MVSISNSFALPSLDPASCPTTTKLVFLDTLAVTRAPAFWARAVAASAREGRQRAGDDHNLAIERAGTSRTTGWLVFDAQASPAQLLDERAILGVAEPFVDSAGDFWADALDALQILEIGGGKGVQRQEPLCQQLRHMRAHAPNVEPH